MNPFDALLDILHLSSVDIETQLPDLSHAVSSVQPLTDFALQVIDPIDLMHQVQNALSTVDLPDFHHGGDTDVNQPYYDFNHPVSHDFNQPHYDFNHLVSHDLAFPRSAGDAEVASGWADWHQSNADRAKEWAAWDVEHNPENLTHHVKEAEEEQVKAHSKREEALSELNK